MTSPVACLLTYSLLSAWRVGGMREAGQVCPCACVIRRRALREQLALSRGPTEGAGEKLSPSHLFYSIYLTPHSEGGVRQGEPWQHRKSGDRDESKHAIWPRFQWKQSQQSLQRGWASEMLANNDVTLLNAQGSHNLSSVLQKQQFAFQSAPYLKRSVFIHE